MDTKDRFDLQKLISLPGPGGIPLIDGLGACVLRSHSQSLREFEKRLGLVHEPGSQEGNLCHAANPEVRWEYRNSFTGDHILAYIHAVLHAKVHAHHLKKSLEDDIMLPYPINPDHFWKLVKIGMELRQCYGNMHPWGDPGPSGREIGALSARVDALGTF